jgi:mRNA interferase RelE/StbE
VKQITYQSEALKSLRKMPANTAKRIRAKVSAYATDPASQANNVARLKGQDNIRLRVGDWRVIMKETTVINVVKIGPRGSIYEGER